MNQHADFLRARESMLPSMFRPGLARVVARAAIVLVLLHFANRAVAQNTPVSPDHPWHGPEERRIEADARNFPEPRTKLDPGKTYSLSELIDLAESHNPETRVAWERASAQAAALGIARSELYPTLVAAALSGVTRSQAYQVNRFFRQTIGDFQVALDLNYTVLDFGARAGRIAAARAEALAANFAFNDTHRQVIVQVQRAYYQLLNAVGQEDAARASLSNAQAVQQAAEERLKNGLATLPDVLEARSGTAQAEYELQSVLGTEQIAAGNLATALGISATVTIHVQPLQELLIPEAVNESGLPDVQRTLNWVHLASRYPVRVRVQDPSPELFRVGESAVVTIRGN
jgi:outer membrane protein